MPPANDASDTAGNSSPAEPTTEARTRLRRPLVIRSEDLDEIVGYQTEAAGPTTNSGCPTVNPLCTPP
jgi:hypothetical protein